MHIGMMIVIGLASFVLFTGSAYVAYQYKDNLHQGLDPTIAGFNDYISFVSNFGNYVKTHNDNNSVQNTPQDTVPKPVTPSTQQPGSVKKQVIDCNVNTGELKWHEQCDPVFLKASPNMKMYYRTGDPKYFNLTEYCIEVPLEVSCQYEKKAQSLGQSEQPTTSKVNILSTYLHDHLSSIQTKLQTYVSKDIITLVNQERTNYGIKPVFNDDSIAQSALNNSVRLEQIKFYSAPDYANAPYKKLASVAHATAEQRLSRICESQYGENVAGAGIGWLTYQSADGKITNIDVDSVAKILVDSWIHSTHGHHENMLHDSWTLTGVGVYLDPDTGLVNATQDFCDSLKPVQ